MLASYVLLLVIPMGGNLKSGRAIGEAIYLWNTRQYPFVRVVLIFACWLLVFRSACCFVRKPAWDSL